mgnify:CR=1 FL=1
MNGTPTRRRPIWPTFRIPQPTWRATSRRWTQGTLFFDVQRIIAAKRPAAFLLENVKNLVSHDKGNTFRVIRGVLEDELGYHVHWKVLDSSPWVPQRRERILIVGFREPTDFDWQDVRLPATAPLLGNILHPQNGREPVESHYTEGPKAKVAERYTLTEHLWKYLQDYAAKHRAAGNGFGYGLVDAASVTRTLSARYYKDGSEILVSQGARKRPRRPAAAPAASARATRSAVPRMCASKASAARSSLPAMALS